MRLTTLCSAEALGAKFLSNLLRKSYCLIWESWGKSQLHTEGKTIEEETLQLISLSPLLLPNTETKVSGSKPVSSKQEEVKRSTITLLSEDSPFIFLLRDTLFCFLPLENVVLPPGPFIPASCWPVTTFSAKSTDVIAAHANFPLCDLSLYAANNNKCSGKSISVSSRPDYG